jgi:hypothetical protein
MGNPGIALQKKAGSRWNRKNRHAAVSNRAQLGHNNPSMFDDSAKIDPSASRTAIELDPLRELHRFEAEFPEIFRLFRLVGIHPRVGKSITNPYSPKNVVGPFENIGLHAIAVATCVEILHSHLVSRNIVPSSSRRRYLEAALIHDLAKPYEICQRLSVANTAAIGSIDADQTLFQFLLRDGFREEDALLILTSGLDAGHRAIHRLMYVDRSGNLRPISGRLEAKLLFLADNMVQTSVPRVEHPYCESLLMECGERLKGSTIRQRYPWLREGGFALDEDFELVEVENISRVGPELTVVGTYLECLYSASNQIALELLPLLGMTPDERRGPSNTVFDLLRDLTAAVEHDRTAPRAVGQ